MVQRIMDIRFLAPDALNRRALENVNAMHGALKLPLSAYPLFDPGRY